MSAGLDVAQARDIAERIQYRQERWQDESLDQSIMVVLLNYGDQFTHVACIAGEWSGTKGDLPVSLGIPKCPNGHVLTESATGRKQLGLIDYEMALP